MFFKNGERSKVRTQVEKNIIQKVKEKAEKYFNVQDLSDSAALEIAKQLGYFIPRRKVSLIVTAKGLRLIGLSQAQFEAAIRQEMRQPPTITQKLAQARRDEQNAKAKIARLMAELKHPATQAEKKVVLAAIIAAL